MDSPIDLVGGFFLGILCAYIIYRVKFASRLNEVLFFPDEKMPCRTFYEQLDNKETQCKQPHCQFAHLSDGRTSFMRIMEILQGTERTIDLCVYDFTESKLADFLIKKFNEGIQIRIVTDAHMERKFVSSSGGGDASPAAPSGDANKQELIVIQTNADTKFREQKNHVRHKSKDRQSNKPNDIDKNKQQQQQPQAVENNHQKGHKNNNNNNNNKHNGGKGKQASNSQQKEPPPAIQMQRVSHKGDQIPSLQRAGIPIRVNAVNGPFGALMHNKFVIVDNKYLMMGSFNWTHSAITRNHEAILLTDHPSIVSEFRNKFKDMWLHLQDRPVDPRF